MNKIEQLKRSVDTIVKNRPSYSEILGFYGQVFEAQELSRQEISLDPITIDADLLALKRENHMPLIDLPQFKVDLKSAKRLFQRICELAQDAAPQLSKEGTAANKAVQKGKLDLEKLFYAILGNNEADIEDMADDLHIEADKMRLFGFLAISPSISICSQQLAGYLEEQAPHKEGYCPICGSRPALAILDEEGHRHLKCSFCFHKWAVKRLECVFCKNSDPEQQQYFYNDEEKEYRVNLCDACGNYIKVVDLRQMNRFFYPGLEFVSTLHLDIEAKKKGYKSSVMS